MGIRLGLIYVLIVSFLGLVSFRLFQLQVLENETLKKAADKRFKRSSKATFRLPLVDRNGKELAVNMKASSIFAHPKLVKNKAHTAKVLAKHLGKSSRYWKRRLSSKRSFVWIRRHIDTKTGKKLSKIKLPGVFVKPENTRVYPNGPLAASIVGFTDIDGKGLAGVEFSQNKRLNLQEFPYPVIRDGKGNASYITKLESDETLNDSPIALTIDRRIQYVVEEELRKTLKKTKAVGIIATVMDPFTGEILAMAQLPSFDPNRARSYPNRLFVNRAVSHRFEPGSTLKALFAAEALEKKLLKTSSKLNGHNGVLKIGPKTFREHNDKHKYETLSLEEVIRYSSNIGAIEVSRKLGTDGVIRTIKKFGLTEKTKIGLPGEVSGFLRAKKKWTPIVLANAAFGQGVAFTPLQMVSAFAPFANGGYLVQPKILRSEVTAVDKEHVDIRRVLSPKTANIMKEILTSVTEHPNGTGKGARVTGVRVAGKTGTAQKYERKKGYKGGKYFSSFIGFLPADHPQLLIGVMVDEPEGDYYGSQVAVPVFQKIATRSLQLLGGVPRQMAKTRPIIRVVPQKSPAPVKLVQSEGKYEMPNLAGITVREALRLFSAEFPNVRLRGSGYLIKQSPSPGRKFTKRTRIRLSFSPAS